MKVYASDIEAVGFYEDVNNVSDIHCIVSIDVDSKECYIFHNHPEIDGAEVVDPYDNNTYIIPPRNGTLEEGVKFWEKISKAGGKLAIHNAHTYDRVVVDKVWPNNKIGFDTYHDTLIQSKVQWFERPTPKGAKSAHGLQAYGVRCGVNKPEVTDWKTFDAFKLHRCIEDCKIQAYTYKYLKKEADHLKKLGIDFTSAIKIESQYAAHVAQQEIRGAKVDVGHIKTSLAWLDEKIKTLAEEIEPNLPPTVKPVTPKISRKELAKLLGYNPDKVKDTYVDKTVDGHIQSVIEKPYATPTVKYQKVLKTKQYYGFHITYGPSPKFGKKKELTDWIKDSYPDTASKEWGIEVDEIERPVLNKNTCEYFGVDEDSDLVAGPFTKVSFTPSKMTQNEVVKGFLIRLGWKEAEEWNLKKDPEGSFIKAEEDIVYRWPKKAAPENQLVKKIRKGDLLVTSPKLTDDDYEQLPEGLGKKVAEYNTYQHRRRFLSNPKDPESKGILSFVRDDGRIPCGVFNFNTATGRSSHRVWVNSPGEKSLFGTEIRKTIIAEDGYKVIGCDQKSSQLSIAAFFAKNSQYYEAVASGQERDENDRYIGESAHCHSARNFGIVSVEEWKKAVDTQDPDLIKSISLRRSASKGSSFGVIFGCSGKKLAGMLKIPEKEGNKKKNNFLKQMGLDGVKDYLETCKDKYPFKCGFYIPLAFGYWVWCSQDHKAINYVIQGTEALAEKLAEIRAAKEIERGGYDAHQILSMHDEMLYEAKEDQVDDVGKIVAGSFTWAADMLYDWYSKNADKFPNKGGPAFKIDLSGGYEVGSNYGEVH